MGQARSKATKSKNSTPLVMGAVVGAIVIALVVAIVVGGGDSESQPVSSGVPVVGGETRPVTVTGEALAPLSDSGVDPAVGETAPRLDGEAFDGSALSIEPGDGRNHMIVFLAHWCPHCNAEVPRLIEWKNSGGVPEGLNVIAVSTAVASDRPNYPPSQWVVDMGWPWPVMPDSDAMDAANAYGVSGFPFFVIVGGDGTVKLRASGEKEIDEISQMVTEALAD